VNIASANVGQLGSVGGGAVGDTVLRDGVDVGFTINSEEQVPHVAGHLRRISGTNVQIDVPTVAQTGSVSTQALLTVSALGGSDGECDVGSLVNDT